MSFTHDDVQRIIQLLNTSHFDELHLELDGIKLDLRRHGAGSPASVATAMPASTPSPGLAAAAAPARSLSASASSASTVPTVATSSSPVAAAGSSASGDLLEVRAPMLGVFYRSPKPGADPFVTPGTAVEPDTVIGIIEVMKLMNSVPANLRGEVVEVLAKDGELVEYDQVLMRVRAVQG
ncbi:MAG: acetyl-CoA carboxylase, biotin carboxyl carrier protein [Alcaligenaceae bacterium]|nr:acetyl-CoA carboxylase, biotin carboxyl carrier protein [Alcaligenaceae bacterium]